MDLNALLAQLKAPADGQSSNEPQSTTGFRQPLASASLASAPLASPQPQALNRAGSGILTPSTASSDRTANLLNLLKFNQPSAGPSIGTQDQNMSRTLSMSKLDSQPPSQSAGMAGLGVGRTASLAVPSASKRGESPLPAPSGTPQDLLLKLLSPKQPAENVEQPTITTLSEQSSSGKVQATGEEVNSELKHAPSEIPHSVNRGAFSFVSPFDQLAASSPRNKQSNTGVNSGRATPDPVKIQKNLRSAGNVASPAPTTLPDGRSQVEALLGIGSSKSAETTVAQALSEVGTTADRQAQDAIARAGAENSAAEEFGYEDTTTIQMGDIQEAIHDAAVELQDDLKDSDMKAVLDAVLPERDTKDFEDTINEIAAETGADGSESAGAEEPPADQEAGTGVRVLGFPMKPFVTIDLVKLPPPSEVREDIVMKIASMKKEFDQVDRTLATATSNFIVYAMARGGGLRLIRQEDGANKQIFRKAENQIYHVEIAAPTASPLTKSVENVLATGVNGSVFWTAVTISMGESFDAEDLDAKGLIFPPLPVADDNNTSAGQLKTRAKLSSRHPEFFAISRGKSIHIIWPALATSAPYINNKSRVVDSEKYLSERCLKIATGKAGKDFTFSEDDTVIVSLDKAGRLKFWDIREHIDPSTIDNPGSYRHVETKTPLMTLPTTSTADKSWATSVMFVDKERPTIKGVALRYLLVGSKQNHTLQLWDLTLMKPVQELNFPHVSEVDPICSVSYHAKTGIIALGHPTRNSVFFMYLSSPKYNLGTISQADFIQRLVAGDPKLPKPESTAIMTGIREISLASLGDLRSLAMTEPASTADKGTDSDGTLCELYVSHSRGVASIDIKRQDLGWDKDGKVFHSVNALEKNMIEVKDLQLFSEAVEGIEASETSSAKPTEPEPVQKAVPQAATKDVPAASKKDKNAKAQPARTEEVAAAPAKASSGPQTPVATATKENSSKVTKPAATEPVVKKVANKTLESFASVAQRGINGKPMASTTPTEETLAGPVSAGTGPMNVDASQLGEAISKALGTTLSDVFGNVLGEQLEKLYKRIDDDKRIQDAAGAAKQDAVLRLVSATLTDNVEKSLSRIVSINIEQTVLPAISKVTADAVKQQLTTSMPKELKESLQLPISKALQEPLVLQSITDNVSSKLTAHVENLFSTTLTQTIVPAFQKLAVETARKSAVEVQARVNEQLQKVNVQHQSDAAKIDQLNVQRQTDSAKIDQLTTLTLEMLEHMRSMTKAVAESQAEISQLRTQLVERESRSYESGPMHSSTDASVKDEELEALIELMSAGALVEATIKWLQSARRVEFFDQLFARYDPHYLNSVDQLITLSVSAAVTDSLEKNVSARLNWLEVALTAIDAQDPVVAEHAGKVMDVVVQRLSDAYMSIAPMEPTSPALSKIHTLVRLAKDIKNGAA